MADIDAVIVKFGPLGFVKEFLVNYLLDRGVRGGGVRDCVMELSESSYEDSSYIDRLECLSEKYDGDYYSDMDYEMPQLTILAVQVSILDSIPHGLDNPLEKFPYHVCVGVMDMYWGITNIKSLTHRLENSYQSSRPSGI